MSVRPLCPELAEKARLELNEDPGRLAEDIQHIKEWISKQPHLRVCTDDQWITTFLRGCKFSLERTKEKLDLYYSMRTCAPDLWRFKHTDPKFMEILDLGVVLFLPKNKDSTAPKMGIVRAGCYDPQKYSIIDIMAVTNVVQQLSLLEDDELVVSGALSLLDLDGVGTGHFMQMTPTLMTKMVVMSQDATPIRLKGTHYINTPTGFETIFNFMKGLLNEKNRSRLFVHNKNYEEMYKYIPKDILPVEYGGSGGTIQEIIDNTKKMVLDHSEWLTKSYTYGSDESKRPGKPKTAEDLFGLEGSFRQLQFD